MVLTCIQFGIVKLQQQSPRCISKILLTLNDNYASSRRIMFGDESTARECFKCINGLRYFSLWRVSGGKLGQVYKTFNPEKMFHATNISTRTNCTNQIGNVEPIKPPKLQRFNHRHRCPERSCARSDAPHKTEDRKY